MRSLLALGADPGIRDNFGRTASTLAAGKGHASVAELLDGTAPHAGEASASQARSTGEAMQKAMALEKEGRLEEAREAYEKIAQGAPGFPDVLARLGYTLQKLGHLQRASDMLGGKYRGGGVSVAETGISFQEGTERLRGEVIEVFTGGEWKLK